MIYRELPKAEYEYLESAILYEDNHLLVVNKAVGDIIQGDKTGDEPLNERYKAFIAARDSKPGAVFMGVAHRLDRPVSGVCIFAKTSKSLSRLNEMFRDGHNIDKYYYALVSAMPSVPEATIENYLIRNEKQNKSYVWKGSGRTSQSQNTQSQIPKDAKLAKLNYKFLEATKTYFLLEVKLLTGRHHQIRCQLADMGCVIKGDLKYGAKRSNPNGGICLHAQRICFIHPVKKLEITIEAPLPSDWKLTI